MIKNKVGTVLKGVAMASLMPKFISCLVIFLIGMFGLVVSVIGTFVLNGNIQSFATTTNISYSNEEYVITLEFTTSEGEVVHFSYPEIGELKDEYVGKVITVYYNPKNPSKNLSIGSRRDGYGIFIISVIFVVLSSMEIYHIIRSVKYLKGIDFNNLAYDEELNDEDSDNFL